MRACLAESSAYCLLRSRASRRCPASGGWPSCSSRVRTCRRSPPAGYPVPGPCRSPLPRGEPYESVHGHVRREAEQCKAVLSLVESPEPDGHPPRLDGGRSGRFPRVLVSGHLEHLRRRCSRLRAGRTLIVISSASAQPQDQGQNCCRHSSSSHLVGVAVSSFRRTDDVVSIAASLGLCNLGATRDTHAMSRRIAIDPATPQATT
jgi:hypothetical protein